MKKSASKMIPLFKVSMHPDVTKEVSETLLSGYIGQGPKVEEFENDLMSKLKCKNLITTNSATSAAHLALSMISRLPTTTDWPGVQPGDEVLTTPLTCTATNWPILANNMKIKWVDVDPNTCNLDINDLEKKISKKTKAILVVHWGGYPNKMDEIKRVQDACYKKHGFRPKVIEDCAHSFGSTYKEKAIGTQGNYAFYSFQAIKHMTTVDGGALILPDEKEYKRAKLLRWYGIDRESNRKDFRCEDDISEWGFKFHMNDVNAVIGIHNLKYVDEIIDRHKSNAKFYDENLRGIPGISLLERSSDCDSSFWIYTLKVDDQDEFMKKMKEKNIMVSRVHERNDKHSCVEEFKTGLPNLDSLSKKMICIPVGWWVSDEERQYIVDSIKGCAV